jgi:hypothetical protein
MLRRAPASQSAQNHLVTKTQSVKRLNPIPLLISDDEIIDGTLGGHRSPEHPVECPFHLFLDRDLLILQFVGIWEIDVVSYVIKSSDEEVVVSGELNNIEHQVDISSLCAGTYYIEVLYNGIVYW